MFAGAFWPPVYMLLFFALIIAAAIRGGGDPDNDLLLPFGVLIGLHIATILLALGATVAYVVHAWRSPLVKRDERTLWILVLLLGGIVAMPVYWWLHLRRGAQPQALTT